MDSCFELERFCLKIPKDPCVVGKKCGNVCWTGQCVDNTPLAETACTKSIPPSCKKSCPPGYNLHANKYCCLPNQFFDGNIGKCRDDIPSEVIDATSSEAASAPDGTKLKLPDVRFCALAIPPPMEVCVKGKTYTDICSARSSDEEIATKGPCCRTNANCELIIHPSCGCYAVKKGDPSPLEPNANCLRFDCPKDSAAICENTQCIRSTDASTKEKDILSEIKKWLQTPAGFIDIFVIFS